MRFTTEILSKRRKKRFSAQFILLVSYNVLRYPLTDLRFKLMFKNDGKIKVCKIMITYFISTQIKSTDRNEVVIGAELKVQKS